MKLTSQAKPRPRCIVCGHWVPPPTNPYRGKPRGHPFCSVKCGYAFALNVFEMSNFTWCAKHERWSDAEGHCSECSFQGPGPDDVIACAGSAQIASDAPPAEKGGGA